MRIFSRPTLFAASAGALVMLTVVSMTIASMEGFPQRVPTSIQKILSYNHYDYAPLYRVGTCFLASADAPRLLANKCLNGDHPSVLLWGDSTAAHYYHALTKLFPQVAILQANMSSCAPIVSYRRILVTSEVRRQRLELAI
jgi:hypothetical protein